MTRSRIARSFLALAAAALVGCGADPKSPTDPGGGGEPDPTATFARVQAEIFTPSCARSGCHGGSSPAQGMNLSAGSAYAAIVNVTARQSTKKRIAPGDPAGSYLLDKIRGAAGITGSRMPLGGPDLDDAKITLVEDWIRRGAPND